MKIEIVYMLRVESPRREDPPHYVSNLCAHDYATDEWQLNAQEWHSEAELLAELAAAEVEGDFEIVKIVRCQAG